MFPIEESSPKNWHTLFTGGPGDGFHPGFGEPSSARDGPEATPCPHEGMMLRRGGSDKVA